MQNKDEEISVLLNVIVASHEEKKKWKRIHRDGVEQKSRALHAGLNSCLYTARFPPRIRCIIAISEFPTERISLTWLYIPLRICVYVYFRTYTPAISLYWKSVPHGGYIILFDDTGSKT